MYLNPVVGKSCNKPGVMEILGGPAGVGRSRKPCDGQTLRAVLLMEGGELEQRSSGHGGVKNDSMSQDSSTGKDGLGHRNRGLQNRFSPGEGSSRWVLVLGGCGAWGGGGGGGLSHSTTQQWSSSPRGLVGVRRLPGSVGSCAWKNMWVCKEKSHRWLGKAESPLFPPWTVSQRCPVLFHLDLPQLLLHRQLLQISTWARGSRELGTQPPRGSHASRVPWWGTTTTWRVPASAGETGAEPCPGPGLELSFVLH